MAHPIIRQNLPMKRIVYELTITMEESVPLEWDADQINFWLNESSWCMGNAFEKLKDMVGNEFCTCQIMRGKFIKDVEIQKELEPWNQSGPNPDEP